MPSPPKNVLTLLIKCIIESLVCHMLACLNDDSTVFWCFILQLQLNGHFYFHYKKWCLECKLQWFLSWTGPLWARRGSKPYQIAPVGLWTCTWGRAAAQIHDGCLWSVCLNMDGDVLDIWMVQSQCSSQSVDDLLIKMTRLFRCSIWRALLPPAFKALHTHTPHTDCLYSGPPEEAVLGTTGVWYAWIW